MFAIDPTEDWLIQLSNLFPDKAMIQSKNIFYSVETMIKKRNILCEFLKEKNIRQGDNIAILENNSFEFIIEIFAIWAIGAIPVPINLKLNDREIAEQLKFIEAKMVFVNDDHFSKSELKSNYNLFRCNDILISETVSFSSNWKFKPSQTALLMFTSGSSGKPKCVELSFNNLLSSAENVINFLRPSKKDIWLASLPFYHIGGFSIITRAILNGNLLKIPESNNLNFLANIIFQGGVNYISLVPTILYKLIKNNVVPNKSIKTIFLGGSKVDSKLVNLALKFGYKITLVYGSTETASMIAVQKLIRGDNFLIFEGRKLLNTDFFIINDSGESVSECQIGEIAVRASSIAKGYFKNPNLTKSKFISDYYLTNDLGKIDNFGHLNVLGRKDDIIISGGENISTLEVTGIIKSITGIDDAHCFGLIDGHWGEKLVLAVVLDPKAIMTKNELKIKITELLPSFKIPKEIFIVNDIPRTAIGKVDMVNLYEIIGVST